MLLLGGAGAATPGKLASAVLRPFIVLPTVSPRGIVLPTVDPAYGIVAAVAQAALSAYDSVTRDSGPIAWLRLADLSGLVAIDQIGNAHPGTISSTGIVYGTKSLLAGDPVSRALTFDGVTGKVDIPYAAALNPATQWSVGAWWQAPVQTFNNPLWDNRPASSGALAAGFDLFLNVGFGIGISVCSTNVAQTIISAAATVNVIHRSIATYDGAQVRLYLDGVLRAGPTTCPYTPNPNKAVGIGHLTGGANLVAGVIQDAAVWGYPLTAKQVANDWKAGSIALGAITTASVGIAVL